MFRNRLVAGALFAAIALAGASTTVLAKQKHRQKREARPYAGWQQTANGTYVQPVGDPRYPGASPSGGRAIQTKDDMDAESFKPSALVERGQSENEGGRMIVTYERTDTEVAEAQPVPRRGGWYIDQGSVYSQEPTVNRRARTTRPR